MERKAVAAETRRKPKNGATVWATAALVTWTAVLIATAALSGLFGELTRHDLLIGALGLGFVVMAAASVCLLRNDLRDYFSPARGQSRNIRR